MLLRIISTIGVKEYAGGDTELGPRQTSGNPITKRVSYHIKAQRGDGHQMYALESEF